MFIYGADVQNYHLTTSKMPMSFLQSSQGYSSLALHSPFTLHIFHHLSYAIQDQEFVIILSYLFHLQPYHPEHADPVI